MPLPPPSPDSASNHNPNVPLSEQTFEQELAAVERSLQDLKERYMQVQQDEQTQVQLQGRKEQLKRQVQRSPSPADLKAELTRLQTQIDELEVKLESKLFSWGSLREPFWQIVRFGGLGIVIGWTIAFAVLQSPNPSPRPPLPEPQPSQPEK